MHDILYARTQTTSSSARKQKKFAKKAKVVKANYEELTDAELSSEFNREDFLITAYLQYLIYAYHLTLPPPPGPSPDATPEPPMTPMTPATPMTPMEMPQDMELDEDGNALNLDPNDSVAQKARSQSFWNMWGSPEEEEEEEIVEEEVEPEPEPEPEEEDDGIDRTGWSQECLEWEQKLDKVAKVVMRAGPKFRAKIWMKFDRRGHGWMTMDKELGRVLYALFAFYVKMREKGKVPPKYSTLLPLVNSLLTEIRDIVNMDDEDQDMENEYIMMDVFVDKFDLYLKKVAKKRLNLEDTPPPPEPTENENGDENQGDGNDGDKNDANMDQKEVQNEDENMNQNEDENVEEEQADRDVVEEEPPPEDVQSENVEDIQEENVEASGVSAAPELTPEPDMIPEQTPDTEAFPEQTPPPELTPEPEPSVRDSVTKSVQDSKEKSKPIV